MISTRVFNTGIDCWKITVKVDSHRYSMRPYKYDNCIQLRIGKDILKVASATAPVHDELKLEKRA